MVFSPASNVGDRSTSNTVFDAEDEEEETEARNDIADASRKLSQRLESSAKARPGRQNMAAVAITTCITRDGACILTEIGDAVQTGRRRDVRPRDVH